MGGLTCEAWNRAFALDGHSWGGGGGYGGVSGGSIGGGGGGELTRAVTCRGRGLGATLVAEPPSDFL